MSSEREPVRAGRANVQGTHDRLHVRWQCVDPALPLEQLKEATEQGSCSQGRPGSKDDQLLLGSSEADVEPPPVLQKVSDLCVHTSAASLGMRSRFTSLPSSLHSI